MSNPPLNGPRLPPLREAATHLVVLCHGYGADGNDLIGLAGEWRATLPGAAFVSPHAPERCAMAGAGYQWFSLARIDPAKTARGAEDAAPVLNAFLDAELDRLGLAPEKLALVGFSQGTMMALQVGLRRAVPPAAIVGFSGMLAGPERVPQAESARPPILLTHGSKDEVIPEAALFLSALTLGQAGYLVQWHRVPGLGHGIDASSMALAGAFLKGALAGRFKPLCTPVGSVLSRTPGA